MTNRSLTKTFNRAVKSATTTRRAGNSDKNVGYQQRAYQGHLEGAALRRFWRHSRLPAMRFLYSVDARITLVLRASHRTRLKRTRQCVHVRSTTCVHCRPHLATRSKEQKKGVGETAGRNVQKTRTAVGHHLTRFLFLGKQRLRAVQQR